MAIVIKDGTRLYLKTWEYNAARITTELARIVNNHGGKVKPTHTAIISDRTVTSAITELENNIERLNKATKKHGTSDRRTEAVKNLERQLEEYKNINNEPITVTHTSYITFILDETLYYYQVDSNPFFDFYWNKTPIKNGKRSRDAALEADNKDWLFDSFLKSNCGQADIVEAANLIFNMLCNAPLSEIIREGRKQRVPNTYNNGYHIETVYKPERVEKIEF